MFDILFVFLYVVGCFFYSGIEKAGSFIAREEAEILRSHSCYGASPFAAISAVGGLRHVPHPVPSASFPLSSSYFNFLVVSFFCLLVHFLFFYIFYF
jgi:hypothetical protein